MADPGAPAPPEALPEPEIAAQILESLADGVLRLDREWRFTYLNPVGERVLGRPREQLLGRDVWTEFPELAGTPFGDAYRRAAATGETQSVEGYYEPFGTWFEVRAFPSDRGLVIFFRDIGERRRLEAQRDEATRRVAEDAELHETLHRVAVTIAVDLDPAAIVQRVTDEATTLCRAAFGAFFYNVNDGQGGSYMLYTLSGAPREAFARFPMPRNTAVFAPTFDGDGVVRSDDITKDPRYGHTPPHHGMPAGHLPVRSYLAVPVLGRASRVLGGLFFGHPEPGVFTEHAERLALGVARLAAVALENAMLHEQAQQAQARLAQGEQRLRTVTENASLALFLMDDRQRCTYMNPAAERMTGFTLAEVQARDQPLHDLIHHLHPDGTPFPMADCPIDRALPQRAREQGEAVFVHADGRFYSVSFTASPILEEGRATGTVIEVRDTTEEKRRAAERDALLASARTAEQRFRSLIEASTQIVWTTTPDGRVEEGSPSWCAFTGQSEEERSGDGWARAVHPEDRAAVQAAWKAAVESRQPLHEEFRLRRADGAWRITVARAAPVLNPDGSVREWVGTNTDVTEERNAVRAVEATQARFRRIFESNVVGFAFTAADGRILDANDAFLHLLGYGREELDTLHWSRIAPGTGLEAQDGATSVPLENEFVARDGRRIPVLLGAAHLPPGSEAAHVAFVVDITARKRAERSLTVLARASRGLLASLDLDTTLQEVARAALPERADWCAVYLKRDDGTLEVATAAHADPSRQALALAIAQRVARARRAAGHLEIMRTLEPVVVEHLDDDALRGVAGDEDDLLAMVRSFAPASLLMVPLVTQGQAIGTMTLGTHDLHRRFTADDVPLAEHLARRAAIAIQNAQLFDLAQRERRRVEEANRAKDEFLAVVSHELRTPLNAILGWSRLLHLGTLAGDQQKRAVEIIDRNARAQAQLIEDLLDVSRIVSGKMRLEIGPVDMAEVVDAALDVVRPAADAKDVKLSAVLDRSMGPLLGDPDRLQQVVWNLVSNAVKFTPRGGRVVVTLTRSDSSCLISVEDTGQGIAPEFLPVVFERFRQASTGTTRTKGGLGLGLAIVRHIAELHGGTVDASSEGEGRGSVFTVRLPIAPLRSAPFAAHPVALANRRAEKVEFLCPPEIAGLKVLVVDDEPDARELLLSLFRECRADVRAAGSAEEAFGLLTEHRPDVLVSDIGMPGQDGFTLIDRIRQLPPEEGGRTPAVALTAYARAEDRTRALLAGFNMHVAKPIEPAELLVVVANLAGRLPARS